MKNKKQITEYVEGLFELYHMDKKGFFSEYDEDTGKWVEVPLFVGHNEIDEQTLHLLSINLGLSEEKIANRDRKAALRMFDRYPFFALYTEYLNEWKWNAQYKNGGSNQDRLLTAIFDLEYSPVSARRYNYGDVKDRLISSLKKTNLTMPDIYHEGADIIDLKIKTEVLFSFEKCHDLISSFLEMHDRLKELFFKSLYHQLEETEIQELNFLASWLEACDYIVPSKTITYDYICSHREIFIKEGYTDFLKYVKLRRFYYGSLIWPTEKFVPWRCKEFFNDMELAQKFVDYYPESKSSMRNFHMLVSCFACTFKWTDANEYTSYYLEKDNDEIEDWAESIHELKKAASPVAQGGLRVVFPTEEEFKELNATQRLMMHVGVQ